MAFSAALWMLLLFSGHTTMPRSCTTGKAITQPLASRATAPDDSAVQNVVGECVGWCVWCVGVCGEEWGEVVWASQLGDYKRGAARRLGRCGFLQLYWGGTGAVGKIERKRKREGGREMDRARERTT